MLKQTPQAVSELLQNNLLKMPWKEMKAYFYFLREWSCDVQTKM